MSNVKGYKVFNSDWTCRNFQYKVGETFVHEGNIEMCGQGFHFCQKASDCFNYYSFNSNNKVAEVEALDLVETRNDKSVTNKLHIIREISWQELLTIVNEGKDNTGLKNTGNCNTGNWNVGNCNVGNCNTGDCNTGNSNVGNRNTGDWNVGDWNTGNWNTGDSNTGNCNVGNRNTGLKNTGNCNTGDRNTGNRNTGDSNTGNCNVGDRNTGNCNTGNCNTGNRNTGDSNTGNCNVGNRNTGNWNVGNSNVGDWNTGDRNTGMFSTITPKITMFEKETDLTITEARELKGVQVLNWNYENNWWIYEDNMTDEEKEQHPEYKTTGGYLKVIPFKEACNLMWSNLDDNDKKAVLELPNFDARIFLEITGIEVVEDIKRLM